MLSRFKKHLQLQDDSPPAEINLGLVFFLGFLEFSAAAISTLVINKDPKNAILLGYSISRILLFMITFVGGISMLVMAVKAYRGEKCALIQIIRKLITWTDISFLLFLVGCLIALLHPSMLHGFRYGFERLKPLLLVVCFLPIQFSFLQVTREKWCWDKTLWIPVFYSMLAVLFVTGFIIITKMGVAPDKVFWNVAGMPLSTVQLITILIGIMICLEVIRLVKKHIPDQKIKYIDISLCLMLYVTAVLIWTNTPFNGHFFADISSPLYQPFPFSDARGRDIGALSITIGQGISFNEHTVSPLYEVFLSVLHSIAGFDYLLLTQLQLYILAFLPVVLYILGKAFHNRFLGLLIAAIVIARQSNAILLSRMIAGSNPYLLTTEMPTYLTVAVCCGLVFWWMKTSHKSPWIPFLAGVVLGMAALIRVNPIILFPAIPVIVLANMWKTKKKWLTQNIAFIIGFLLLIVPWLFTGITEDGNSFFLQKFYNVIDQRYDSSGQFPQADDDYSFDKSLSSIHFRMNISLGSIDKDESIFNIYEFPGFVVNHFFHNIVTSILILPDSIAPSDQVLSELALRPYWVEKNTWSGELQTGQKLFLFLNISLISFAIGWSWKHWRWAGLMPAYLYLVYLISLGFARVSGSRYIVPVDWIIIFYYSIGVMMLLGIIARYLKLTVKREFEISIETSTLVNTGIIRKWLLPIALVSILFISASIPIADNLIPENKLLCQDKTYQSKAIALYEENSQNVLFIIGRLLYPKINDNTLSTTFFTCNDSISLEIQEFQGELSNGELVVIAFGFPFQEWNPEVIISYETDTPVVIWERK